MWSNIDKNYNKSNSVKKNEAKIWRVTAFVIAKLEEQQLNGELGGKREKSNIAIAILDK